MAGVLLDVEPQDFVTSSSSASSAARAAASAGSRLRAALSGSTQMAGSDPAGLKWAAQYDQVAADAVRGLDSLETVLGQVSAGLAVTGLNYATADWLSAGHSGYAPGYSVPSLPGAVCSSPPPSSAGGSRKSSIPGFEYVANFIGEMWPDGDTGKLRAAKSAWGSFADDLDSIRSGDITRIKSGLDGNHTPELPTIDSTITSIGTAAGKLADEARNLATACGKLATEIDHVHQQTEQVLNSLVEQLAATAVVGIGLTIFTAGLSDGAAALAGGGEIAAAVARILGFIAELGTNVARVVDDIAVSAGSIAKVAGISEQITIRVVTIAGKSVVTGVGGAFTNVGVQEIVDPGTDIDAAAVQGFVGGAAFGVLADGAKLAGSTLGARDAARSVSEAPVVASEASRAETVVPVTDEMAPEFVDLEPAAAKSADGFVMRESSEPLYRSDDREPEEIFAEGFQPKFPENNDLEHFVLTNSQSNFVSTTTNENLYSRWFKKYRYTIDAPGGIDVNRSLPDNRFASESEIAFQGGVPAPHVVGAHPVLPSGDLGTWIPNPERAVK